MTARILEVGPDAYHKLPGLSPSTATVLIQQSPLHAMTSQGKAPTKLMDRGSVMHTMILGDGKKFCVLDHDDWRTKDARADRDSTRARGLVPILRHEYDEATQATVAILSRMRTMGIRLDGDSEVALSWTEQSSAGPVECRTMLDHFVRSRGEVTELKIVDDASPARMERSAESMGYAIAYAARVRAISALDPQLAGRVRYRFLFCEAVPPYAIHAPYPDGTFRELGEQRWTRAVEAWGKCTASGKWTAYEEYQSITAPGWALAREGFPSDER